ncbi:GFA family protein [Enhygromyxa salina]|uniref:Glutathione-dependent formaldehyde-activating enzyme n=1 Tax=Enhygromyxa salina TaxID=215803 RepID=A0A2S9Y887_9BACT|nr:GFA family protein [Enhygromyxa salina]PRQ01324.1 Glutathione-dependent formaldehyde-activating enzyme [Enhygromyxa salina]
MPMPPLPIEGGCRCERVRFRVTRPPMLTMACHCVGCQKMSASAFSTSVAVPSDGFEVTAGEPVIGGLHGEQARHHHCEWCKSWLFTRIEPDMGFVNIRATMLDDPSWFVPFIETYTSEALAWAKTSAAHSFETFPPMDAYEDLIAGFVHAQS